jgi:hypothetical protein
MEYALISGENLRLSLASGAKLNLKSLGTENGRWKMLTHDNQQNVHCSFGVE